MRGYFSVMQESSKMANPFVRMVVNLVVMGAGVFSRAFVAAYHQAIQSEYYLRSEASTPCSSYVPHRALFAYMSDLFLTDMVGQTRRTEVPRLLKPLLEGAWRRMRRSRC
jgi:hypothetical protein